MTSRILLRLGLAVPALLVLGCTLEPPTEPMVSFAPGRASGKPAPFATLISLPLIAGRTGEALAVNNAGTVIAGYVWESTSGIMRALRWNLEPDGSWTVTPLPHAAAATGAIARAVNREGQVAGNDWPATLPHPVLWPATGGFSIQGCGDPGEVYGISADGQGLVGSRPIGTGTAVVWNPGSCGEDLPNLTAIGKAQARTVNRNGTLIGGFGSTSPSSPSYPVRWTGGVGSWQIDQLDAHSGAVLGGNDGGDLAGYVRVTCDLADGCARAMIWYADGSARQLGTLGGDHSSSADLNAAGEVVGNSSRSNGVQTGFFWSPATGMLKLPYNGDFAVAKAISDARVDGSRLVVGVSTKGKPVAWVIH